MAALEQNEHGIGLAHRQGRWTLTLQFLRGILTLLLFFQARLLVIILEKLHIAYRPHWLVRIAESRNEETKCRQANSPVEQDPMRATGPSNIPFDIETFARERMHKSGAYNELNPNESEENISNYLYNWFKNGGKWGDVDTSGDFAPSLFDDDDNTSVTSFSTTSNASEWSGSEDEGQRTPTQSSNRYSRESTPIQENTLDLARLAYLLDPQSKEDREEARMLGRHLQSSGVMTRSQYHKAMRNADVKLLASSRYCKTEGGLMSPEEEEQILQDFVLDRRDAAARSNVGSWDSGAEGMGAEGPQCVVCQVSPRTVIVWPCGCLSLCDECRVGLASKNYTTCVCCRTNVMAYSRLFVP